MRLLPPTGRNDNVLFRQCERKRSNPEVKACLFHLTYYMKYDIIFTNGNLSTHRAVAQHPISLRIRMDGSYDRKISESFRQTGRGREVISEKKMERAVIGWYIRTIRIYRVICHILLFQRMRMRYW